MALANCSIVSLEERITGHHESRGCPGKGFYCRPIPGVTRPRSRGRGQITVVRRILLNAQRSNLHMCRIGNHLVLVNIRWFESHPILRFWASRYCGSDPPNSLP